MNFQTESMTEARAKEVLVEQDEQSVAALRFTEVNDYTTFRAEFAIDGDDLVFHFFLPPEFSSLSGPVIAQRVDRYWKDGFPRALDGTARDFFKADFPTLKAAYTTELNSWWLRANGFGNNVDPEARCRLFIQKLDAALDQAKEAEKVSQRSV